MYERYGNYLGGIYKAKIQFAKDLLLDKDYISHFKNSFFEYGVINITSRNWDLSQYNDLPSNQFIKQYIKENQKKSFMTKLQNILKERKMSQRDLQRAIYDIYEVKIGDAMLSRIVNGRVVNLHLKTAKMIAETLDLKIEEIIEI